jgi:hypothetical protein
MAWLRAHGWNAPRGTPKQATPDKDPDGSPNYFSDVPTSVSTSDLASMISDTLIHGLGLPQPGYLSYESFDAEGGALAFQELGLKPSARADTPSMDQVLSVYRDVTGIEDLAFDEDGDVSVRYGAIVISAVQLNNRVRLFSALVTEPTETQALLRKINQINDGVHRIRVFLHDHVVYAALDVPADPFVPAHLVAAMNEFSEVAEGLAIVLRAEFSGKAVPFAHHLHQLVLEQPGALVANPQVAFEFQGRDVVLGLSQQVHRQEPGRQRQLGRFKHRSAQDRGLFPARGALPIRQTLALKRAMATLSALRADETIGPALSDHRRMAFLLCPVASHELDHRQTLLKLHRVDSHRASPSSKMRSFFTPSGSPREPAELCG